MVEHSCVVGYGIVVDFNSLEKFANSQGITGVSDIDEILDRAYGISTFRWHSNDDGTFVTVGEVFVASFDDDMKSGVVIEPIHLKKSEVDALKDLQRELNGSDPKLRVFLVEM